MRRHGHQDGRRSAHQSEVVADGKHSTAASRVRLHLDVDVLVVRPPERGRLMRGQAPPLASSSTR